jgi:LPXTG-motif cell wall-anchored protein
VVDPTVATAPVGAAPGPVDGGTLPRTGNDPAGLVATALALALAGIATLRARRRIGGSAPPPA